ncbi:calcineurin b-like protein [Sarracenia purpurea var. burkii]
MEEQKLQWIPSEYGDHKVNVDVAYDTTKRSISGLRILVRNWEEKFIAGYAQRLPRWSFPITTEALAILIGLKLVCDLNLRFLEVESDAQMVQTEGSGNESSLEKVLSNGYTKSNGEDTEEKKTEAPTFLNDDNFCRCDANNHHPPASEVSCTRTETFSVHRTMHRFVGCFCLRKGGHNPGCKEHTVLASETTFTANEVEALYTLYKRLSSSIIDDGLIHKEEFKLALLNNSSKHNLFADRLFDLFDLKKNGVIEFEEFVRSLSIFHPNAPEADKLAFVFRMYDLRCTGYIERDELKELVLALLNESDLTLPNDAVEAIVDKTIVEADLKGDGRIDPEEWKELVSRRPSIMKIMTVPILKEVTLAFPSFVLNTEVQDSELVS